MMTRNKKLKRKILNRMAYTKCRKRKATTLALVLIALFILASLGSGLLTIAYGVRHRAVCMKNEAAAMLAAEAGYEKAVFWMSQQMDVLSALQDGIPGTTGHLDFPDSDCDYQIEFFTFSGSRPIYRIIADGHSGQFNRTVNVLVMQAISGWDMGMSRVLMGGTDTTPVHFASSEIIDMQMHINNLHDNPDNRDIYITGDPRFLQTVGMGESRETEGGTDKYDGIMPLFEGGIYFDQPDSRITDEAAVQSKLNRFEESTDSQFVFDPVASAPVSRPHPAVQLEFFVEAGVGKVRITNNCTVLGYQRGSDSRTLDFKITPGTDGEESERYDIYAYHYIPVDAERITYDVEETYVTQSIGGIESDEGGQIFVDGDVIIGGDRTEHNGDQLIKGSIAVVATGNIWIADAVKVDGPRDMNYMPTRENPNVLGLIAKGVIKVVDPGMSEYGTGYPNYYPGPPATLTDFVYVPIGRSDGAAQPYKRHLPDPMVLEAAITVGGGGWGAENVRWNGYGGRKEAPYTGTTNDLILRGTITEAARGAVGLIGTDGFLKQYYSDTRLLEGVLPGDIWLRGKYVPTPAGWHDYRTEI